VKKLDVALRQEHHAGEKFFIDYASHPHNFKQVMNPIRATGEVERGCRFFRNDREITEYQTLSRLMNQYHVSSLRGQPAVNRFGLRTVINRRSNMGQVWELLTD
jgi:hypothetical protein